MKENLEKLFKKVTRKLKIIRTIKKILEIGALLSTGLCFIFNIWEYIYIPANCTVACIVTGAIAMVLYIVSIVLEDYC